MARLPYQGQEKGAIMLDPIDYVEIARAATELGVSRNDMYLIPVKRWRILQTQWYVWGDLQKWAGQDINSPNSLLQKLRKKKAEAAQKQEKRRNPYTKTGKVKQRFRILTSIQCLRCGGNLHNETRPPDVAAVGKLKKMLKRIGCTSADLNVQHEKLSLYRNHLGYLVNILFDYNKPLPEKEKIIRAYLLDDLFDDKKPLDEKEDIIFRFHDDVEDSVMQIERLLESSNKPRIARCSRCKARFWIGDGGHERNDGDISESVDDGDLFHPLDDDIRAMTTSTFLREADDVRDIPDNDLDKYKE